MTENEFRKLALSMPGACECSHMNHPDFRIEKKIFASLGYPDTGWAMVRLTPEQQSSFMKQAPAVFSPCAGAWGRQGATSINLAIAPRKTIEVALSSARENLVSKLKPKRKSKQSN
jgi:hypothetical protein